MIFILFYWFTFQFYPWLSFLKPLNCPRILKPSQFYFSLTNKIFLAKFNNNPQVLLVHLNTQNKKEEISHGYKERTNLELKITRGRSSSEFVVYHSSLLLSLFTRNSNHHVHQFNHLLYGKRKPQFLTLWWWVSIYL